MPDYRRSRHLLIHHFFGMVDNDQDGDQLQDRGTVTCMTDRQGATTNAVTALAIINRLAIRIWEIG